MTTALSSIMSEPISAVEEEEGKSLSSIISEPSVAVETDDCNICFFHHV